jgi:hypothetical protein
MTSSPDGYSVLIDALRRDAATWADLADRLSATASTAAAASLGRHQFGWVADRCGLTEAYSALQCRLTELLHDGSRRMESVSATLLRVVDRYERTDQTHAVRLAALTS